MNNNIKSAVDCVLWGAAFVCVGLVLPSLVIWMLYHLALASVIPTTNYFASLEGVGLITSVMVGVSRAQIKHCLGVLADYVVDLILFWDRHIHRNSQELALPLYVMSFYALCGLTLFTLYLLFSFIGSVGNSFVGLFF
ncbi:hypothetical protein [Vibrio crassostreae]|uniref:hypothetical protein n=1 Tax=Vibrio crassostreae TaxID=246167 RepID=UPI001B310B0E|nr:hypothetical protein [Vibrio crassostreae]